MTTIRRSVTTAIAAAMIGIAGLTTLSACGGDQPADRSQDTGKPAIAASWETAWNGADPKGLAALFVKDGARYTDHAFGRTVNGQDGIAGWAGTTKQFIQGAGLKVDGSFAGNGRVAINWTFSGQVAGAPKPFSVPAVAILEMRDNEIVSDDDYYNLADVLRQSGLPADTNFG